jgi:hypothetical protein
VQVPGEQRGLQHTPQSGQKIKNSIPEKKMKFLPYRDKKLQFLMKKSVILNISLVGQKSPIFFSYLDKKLFIFPSRTKNANTYGHQCSQSSTF